jgi:hypothetical protein
MINKKCNSKKQPQPQPQSPARGPAAVSAPKAQTIKLGVDMHLGHYVVVRVIDGGTHQPPQRFNLHPRFYTNQWNNLGRNQNPEAAG